MSVIRYTTKWAATSRQFVLVVVLAAVALVMVVSAGLIGAQTSKTLRIVEPGAGGAALDLSSFSAASASFGADSISVQWPNAAGLGSQAITGASVTIDQAQLAIVVEGNITVGGDSFRALFIADWAADVSTPTLSLTLDGNLDLSSLNSSWLAPTGAVVIDGKAIIATGEQ
ncbi:MAG: hypothetical protein GXP35_15070, partial [Actinobacteria bacterium]|nr:hypothetical protein [Actinomycetota bacterium]